MNPTIIPVYFKQKRLNTQQTKIIKIAPRPTFFINSLSLIMPDINDPITAPIPKTIKNRPIVTELSGLFGRIFDTDVEMKPKHKPSKASTAKIGFI